ncbi:DMT family transporter [Halostella sp. PRR32]|uniref:EamA family transporter n=1 Tax=Halostella sp. PRR32 TaxID=3098147 RepID=UPI002B1D7A45|nr:DMT family transporter [Halostella sp. PRR32]
MTNATILFALAAMVSWGVWAVLADVATRYIDPVSAMIFSYATSVAIALAYVFARDQPVATAKTGVAVALGAGVFAGIAAVAFYAGLERGQTSIVTTVSALYFVVAAVLGIAVLGESVEATDVAGVGFAVLSVVLIAR